MERSGSGGRTVLKKLVRDSPSVDTLSSASRKTLNYPEMTEE